MFLNSKFLIDSFSLLRRCIDFKDSCAIVISASKDCFIAYFRGFDKVKCEVIPIDSLSNIYNNYKYFTIRLLYLMIILSNLLSQNQY